MLSHRRPLLAPSALPGTGAEGVTRSEGNTGRTRQREPGEGSVSPSVSGSEGERVPLTAFCPQDSADSTSPERSITDGNPVLDPQPEAEGDPGKGVCWPHSHDVSFEDRDLDADHPATGECDRHRLRLSQPLWHLARADRPSVALYLQAQPVGVFIVSGQCRPLPTHTPPQVRESSKANTLALSVRLPAGRGPHVEHYLVERGEAGLCLEGSEHGFPSELDLVAHYAACCDELPVPLSLPPVLLSSSHEQVTSLALLGAQFWQSKLASVHRLPEKSLDSHSLAPIRQPQSRHTPSPLSSARSGPSQTPSPAPLTPGTPTEPPTRPKLPARQTGPPPPLPPRAQQETPLVTECTAVEATPGRDECVLRLLSPVSLAESASPARAGSEAGSDPRASLAPPSAFYMEPVDALSVCPSRKRHSDPSASSHYESYECHSSVSASLNPYSLGLSLESLLLAFKTRLASLASHPGPVPARPDQAFSTVDSAWQWLDCTGPTADSQPPRGVEINNNTESGESKSATRPDPASQHRVALCPDTHRERTARLLGNHLIHVNSFLLRLGHSGLDSQADYDDVAGDEAEVEGSGRGLSADGVILNMAFNVSQYLSELAARGDTTFGQCIGHFVDCTRQSGQCNPLT